MDYAAIVAIQVLNAAAVLILISSGLAIIFGMMRIINIAHGEFLMLGAYALLVAVRHGINLWMAMFVVAPIAVGVFGIIVERCLIRFLYGRIVDSLLATWGLSLFLSGGIAMIFGNDVEGVRTPLGTLIIGGFRTSWYTVFMIAVAAILLLSIALVLRFTRLGLISRATMQNPDMAAGLGVSPSATYAATFGTGAALAGLAGAILAPMTGVSPTMGSAFIAKAFVTVIGGGASVVTGTGLAAGFFAVINQAATFSKTTVWGDAATLFAAVIMLRLLPRGITGRFFKGSI
jgi:branched-subunit amino acid ABC-type transport system permease component